MKTSIKHLFLLPALIAGLGLIPAGRMTAQTFTTLHSFDGSDGRYPRRLILSGNTLYGTASRGGSSVNTYSGSGAVFKVNTDGTSFTTLYNFTTARYDPTGAFFNVDGFEPYDGLILSGNTLYGTAQGGGNFGRGTVFAINTDGADFRILHSFFGPTSDGTAPFAGLILSGNTLYGTTRFGGDIADHGTVFAVNTNGTAFTILHRFTAGVGSFPFINSDGAYPGAGRLIVSGNTLYGTAAFGGSSGYGTVFKVNTNGTGFTTLHSFTAAPFPDPSTNSDGASPEAGLILSGNTLYGTAGRGGSSGNGTVFAVNTNGTAFTTLYSFTATPAYPSPSINSDGASPNGLILSGNTLYGTAQGGGAWGSGTMFAVSTDGTGFTNLYSFTAISAGTNSDGAGPRGLILSGNTLYGAAVSGGSSGWGTVFSLSLPSISAPQLTLASDGSRGYFIRAQGDPNFTCRLQRAPDLSGPWDTLDTQTAPSGLIEFRDTTPLPGQAFYRTAQP